MLIHGREYTPVAERVAAVHASGKSFEIIESQPIQMGERWVWRCTILLDGLRYIGSAEVHTNARPGSADATDPAACAETSAIGRALGFAGVLSLDGIASADELTRDVPTVPQGQPTARHENGTSHHTAQSTPATPAPTGGQELASEIAALKTDFEQLYPEKAGIWNAVLTRQFGKLPQRWTPEMLVQMKGYYLQCVEKVTARRAAQESAA